MDIVICLNDDYLMPATVMLCSLFRNNKSENITIHAILGKSGMDCKKNLQEISEEYGQTIIFYEMNQKDTILLPVNKHGQRANISKEAYYRLFLTEVLPQTISKIIYLDCDIIVEGNLSELFDIDINSFALAAIPDFRNDDVHNTNRLKYDLSFGYFNSGVLLINLDYWRRVNAVEKFTSYIESNMDNLTYHDQDVLNYVFHDVRKELPLKFNFQTNYLFKDKFRYLNYKYHKEVRLAKKEPVIVHFTEDKPWFYNSPNPMKDYFYKYQNLTIYKGRRLKRKVSLKARIIHTLICIQRRTLSYYKSNYDDFN